MSWRERVASATTLDSTFHSAKLLREVRPTMRASSSTLLEALRERAAERGMRSPSLFSSTASIGSSGSPTRSSIAERAASRASSPRPVGRGRGLSFYTRRISNTSAVFSDASMRAWWRSPRTPPTRRESSIVFRGFVRWQPMLGQKVIGIEDDFFALGGHSLMATQVAARLGSAFGMSIPVAVLFDAPTIAQAAEWIEPAKGKQSSRTGGALFGPIPRAARRKMTVSPAR